jgi:hypothetical protein
MSLVIPEILYANLARYAGVTPVYSGGTANPNFPLVNAFDWKDWTLFEVQQGTTDITFSYPFAQPISGFGWFFKTLPITETGYSVRLYYETASPGVFTPLTNAISIESYPLGMVTFPGVSIPGGKNILIRFVIPTGKVLYCRSLCVGPALIPPIGQQVGVAPPSLQQSWKLSNGMSVNGSLISRSLVRLVKEYNIDLEYLTPAFVDTYWKPFCTHALKYPFFFKWSPTNYPSDCMFAAANSVPAPEYQKPHLMRAKMPIMGLTQ